MLTAKSAQFVQSLTGVGMRYEVGSGTGAAFGPPVTISVPVGEMGGVRIAESNLSRALSVVIMLNNKKTKRFFTMALNVLADVEVGPAPTHGDGRD